MEEVEIKKVATLARLALDNSEVESLKLKFEKILEHFAELEKLDTSGVEPLFHFSNEMPLVDDEPLKPLDTAKLLENAPDSFDDNFRITRVVGESTE